MTPTHMTVSIRGHVGAAPRYAKTERNSGPLIFWVTDSPRTGRPTWIEVVAEGGLGRRLYPELAAGDTVTVKGTLSNWGNLHPYRVVVKATAIEVEPVDEETRERLVRDCSPPPNAEELRVAYNDERHTPGRSFR